MTGQLWVPFAERRDMPLRDSQKKTIRPVGLVRHTAVTDATVAVPTGTTRWHFYLNRSGQLYQFFPVNRPAACQLDGNYWEVGGEGRGFISCESWDGAGRVWDGRNVNDCPPWNTAQLDTWARLDVWLHQQWDIPLITATGPRGTGIGYHSQFNTGDLVWTRTHACPTQARIRQMPSMLTRSIALAQEADDMPTAQEIARATVQEMIDVLGNGAVLDDGRVRVGDEWAGGVFQEIGRIRGDLTGARKQLESLAARPPVDIDEVALAAILGPLLAEFIDGEITDETVNRIAAAVRANLAAALVTPTT